VINYELAQKQGPGLKAALTRAKNIADPAKRYAAVLAACTKAVKAWEQWGAWPDQWAMWNVALSDAAYAVARTGNTEVSYVWRLEDL